MVIESRSNAAVKQARSLFAAKYRRETGLHFIEGDKLVLDAALSGAHIDTLFVEDGADFACAADKTLLVTRSVMESLCTADTPQRACAVVKTPDTKAPQEYPSGLVIALDGVQDPGNAGTIIRTADALGAAGVLMGAGCADPFSGKTVRATMGSAYHIPIWQCDMTRELTRLRSAGYTLVCGHLAGESRLPDMGRDRVLVIGSEGSGVSRETEQLCELYRLPMRGRAESLNAAVAAAIIMWEIVNHG